jgi:hypothetical protein
MLQMPQTQVPSLNKLLSSRIMLPITLVMLGFFLSNQTAARIIWHFFVLTQLTQYTQVTHLASGGSSLITKYTGYREDELEEKGGAHLYSDRMKCNEEQKARFQDIFFHRKCPPCFLALVSFDWLGTSTSSTSPQLI